MEVLIRGKNIDVTPRLEEYVESKAARLGRKLGTITEVRVDLAVENTRSNSDSQVAQFTVHSKRTILRAEERSDDMFASIDAVIDKLHRQIERYKGRRQQRYRGGDTDLGLEAEPVVEEPVREIVRAKRFDVHPMSPEEAVEQMELLGHDFFLFYNPEEAGINLVYRRRDGNYGLLYPVLP
jgi:putative sigma-54 modulation protein